MPAGWDEDHVARPLHALDHRELARHGAPLQPRMLIQEPAHGQLMLSLGKVLETVHGHVGLGREHAPALAPGQAHVPRARAQRVHVQEGAAARAAKEAVARAL
jgi:hypothetical protein